MYHHDFIETENQKKTASKHEKNEEKNIVDFFENIGSSFTHRF